MYYLINKAGKRLSAFYPNDLKPKLVYREGDWYCYQTLEEAEKHLNYILGFNIGNTLVICQSVKGE